ncbi:MAG: hypothetical protein ACRDFC_07410, partial [Ignavibacteria bacterium]
RSNQLSYWPSVSGIFQSCLDKVGKFYRALPCLIDECFPDYRDDPKFKEQICYHSKIFHILFS